MYTVHVYVLDICTCVNERIKLSANEVGLWGFNYIHACAIVHLYRCAGKCFRVFPRNRTDCNFYIAHTKHGIKGQNMFYISWKFVIVLRASSTAFFNEFVCSFCYRCALVFGFWKSTFAYGHSHKYALNMWWQISFLIQLKSAYVV